VLRAEPGLQFAGRVLTDPTSGRPVVYTENLFVRFIPGASNRKCKQLLRDYRLTIRGVPEQVPNTFFVSAPTGTGLVTFEIADRLLADEMVELCHPELIRKKRSRAAFPQQWHLKKTTVNGRSVSAHANVEAAWALSTGKRTTIAVIDDGVDVGHEEFAGAHKIVAPRDATNRTNDARPKLQASPANDDEGDAHGTACAGVACANGKHGASGVAPDAKLMPIRLSSGLGSMREHDAFMWAVEHGADVISCSWGPEDGEPSDPNDPTHRQVTYLPDSTRTAIEFAIRHGRNGKGCVITWAAGNGNESVDNDHYANNEYVLAVAACNDRSKKSSYSDHGKAIWCSFPSDDEGPPEPRTPGIWTTDRDDIAGEGYNPHFSGGDAAGKYTDAFGGTSSACPGVAGVAALILARNPSLTWSEVKEIIKQSCDRIDRTGGRYDSSGHSRKYGFGRVNAKKAVELATY
jgi:subtilisin family serine protease